MPAHTPGPWTYKATAGNHDFAIYPETTGRDVALVRDFNEANARLIAAAPDTAAERDRLKAVNAEMYETLQHFREWWANHFEDFDADTNAELLHLDNEAASAIAAAEGSAE